MVGGFVAAILPPLAAPFGATEHEFYDLIARHLWWQFGGWTACVLGNLVRLVGVQGHPGLPWPGRRGRVPFELIALVQLRRRAFENRAKARSLVSSAR
jgi:hypothetical protein